MAPQNKIYQPLSEHKICSESILCCLVHEDLGYFGSLNGMIYIVDLKTMKNLTSFKAHTEPVRALCVGNHLLFSGSTDSSIKIWEIDGLDHRETIQAHVESVTALMTKGKNLISASRDATIRVWDIDTLENRVTIKDHLGAIWDLKYDDIEDNYFYSCASDNTIRKWNCANWRLEETLNLKNPVYVLGLTRDYLIGGCINSSYHMINRLTREHCFSGYVSKGSIHALCIHKSYLFLGSDFGLVKIFNFKILREKGNLRFNKQNIHAITTYQNELLVAYADGTIRMWNLSDIDENEKDLDITSKINPTESLLK